MRKSAVTLTCLCRDTVLAPDIVLDDGFQILPRWTAVHSHERLWRHKGPGTSERISQRKQIHMELYPSHFETPLPNGLEGNPALINLI